MTARRLIVALSDTSWAFGSGGVVRKASRAMRPLAPWAEALCAARRSRAACARAPEVRASTTSMSSAALIPAGEGQARTPSHGRLSSHSTTSAAKGDRACKAASRICAPNTQEPVDSLNWSASRPAKKMPWAGSSRSARVARSPMR
ncbi:hypothetical protein D3C80_907860 [compost metagenome]